jgi:hypothetical protein
MKYNMERAEKKAIEWLFAPQFLDQDPVLLFFIACHYRMKKEALMAAKATVGRPILERPYAAEMEHISAGQLYHLLAYQKRCKKVIIAVATDFTWIALTSSLTQYCGNCSTKKAKIGEGYLRSLPSWWFDYMQGIVAALKNETWHQGKNADLMNEAWKQGWKCGSCGPKVVDDVQEFTDKFRAEVEQEISEVSACLVFAWSISHIHFVARFSWTSTFNTQGRHIIRIREAAFKLPGVRIILP